MEAIKTELLGKEKLRKGFLNIRHNPLTRKEIPVHMLCITYILIECKDTV